MLVTSRIHLDRWTTGSTGMSEAVTDRLPNYFTGGALNFSSRITLEL